MAKRFFISHAGSDKPLAVELKSLLDGDAWVDLLEIELGQILWHEISDGIEEATDFVLLWSAASAQSRWVEYEITLAFTRWLDDRAIALRIICLDDTSVPFRLRPFLQARDAKSAPQIADALRRNEPAPVPRRRFFNRKEEIGTIAGRPTCWWPPRTGAYGHSRSWRRPSSLTHRSGWNRDVRIVSIHAGTPKA